MKSIEGAKGELQSQLLQLEEQVVLIIAILIVVLIIIAIMIRLSGSKGLSVDWRKRETGKQS